MAPLSLTMHGRYHHDTLAGWFGGAAGSHRANGVLLLLVPSVSDAVMPNLEARA